MRDIPNLVVGEVSIPWAKGRTLRELRRRAVILLLVNERVLRQYHCALNFFHVFVGKLIR